MKITSLYDTKDCIKERPEPIAVVIKNNKVLFRNSYSMVLKWAKKHIRMNYDQIRIYNNKNSNIADDIIIKSKKIKNCLWSTKYNQHI